MEGCRVAPSRWACCLVACSAQLTFASLPGLHPIFIFILLRVLLVPNTTISKLAAKLFYSFALNTIAGSSLHSR